MHLLTKLCFSGLLGIAWSAPPCKEFSRLKLERPGPKPLRTPQHMDGVPGLMEAEQAKVTASTGIHARSRTLLRTVVSKAGQAGMEQPPSALSWLQQDNIAMLREWSAHCAYVAACNHGMPVYKSWAFYASLQSIARLAIPCNHAPGRDQSIAGVQVDGQSFSALTAEYPPSLASALAELMMPFVTQNGHISSSISDFADLLTEDFVPRRLRLCDGAGLHSTADHINTKANSMHDLASEWISCFHQHGRTSSPALHAST